MSISKIASNIASKATRVKTSRIKSDYVRGGLYSPWCWKGKICEKSQLLLPSTALLKLLRKLDDCPPVAVESGAVLARTRLEEDWARRAESSAHCLLEKFSDHRVRASPVKWIIGDIGAHRNKQTVVYDGPLTGRKRDSANTFHLCALSLFSSSLAFLSLWCFSFWTRRHAFRESSIFLFKQKEEKENSLIRIDSSS